MPANPAPHAVISLCGKYRYRLERHWSPLAGPTWAFFGVNPSTADADKEDATTRKWREEHALRDVSSTGGSRRLVIDPDVIADFTAMPFSDERFYLVVFDPPHFTRNGSSGWMAKKYGKLPAEWGKFIRAGFAECFRVLRPNGVLVFKWNENEIPVSRILELTDAKPLFGNKCGKNSQSHWIVFIKDGGER